MAITKNDEFAMQIESLTALGSGIGHHDGLAVFVQGGVPQDTVLCHVIRAKKNYAIAKIVEILEPSPARIPSDCPYFPQCGGCALRTLDYAAEAAAKKQQVEDAFSHLAAMDIPCEEILTGTQNRYRNKAQYPVTMENGTLKIGFYAPHSHRVTDCADCLLQPEEFKTIVDVFREFIIENHISVYDAQTGLGLLRHIYLRKAFATGEIMVCAVANGTTLPLSELLVEKLLKAVSSIKTVLLNVNKDRTNVILGKENEVLYGDGYIEDVLCGVKVRLSALSFYQVNREMAEKLYLKAAEFAALTGNETVLDLYCGTGTIGLSLSKNAKRVIGVEVIPEAIEDAKENARRNGISHAEFYCGDAKYAAKRLADEGVNPDVVLLDPPRKGCDSEVLETVSTMEPEKIVYVSCDPATLARDAKRLQELGYQVVRLCAVDLFARTAHVESVALFLKAASAEK